MVADDVFFIHIPKNAGTSVEIAFALDVVHQELWGMGSSNECAPRDHPRRNHIREMFNNKARGLWKQIGRNWRYSEPSHLFGAKDVELVLQHLTLREVLGLGLIDLSVARRVSFFYVVRDPYTRLLSLWKESRVRGGSVESLDYFLGRLVNTSCVRGPAWAQHDWMSRRRLQCEFFDISGSVFEGEKISLAELRFESLHHDLGKFCQENHLGELHLPHHNSSGDEQVDLFSSVSRERINEINAYYARDFLCLGYPLREI